METSAPVQSQIAPSETRRWLVGIGYALGLAAFSAIYVSITGEDLTSLRAWSFISAAVASLLFATSLSIGSLFYYFKWPDVRWGYQKQIGILAFVCAFVYSVSLVVLYPETYGYGLKDHLFTADVIFGTAAMLIFVAMVFINMKPFSGFVSKETIKFVLGLGYIGYAFLVIRAVLIEWPVWFDWMTTLAGFPPGRFILSLIAFCVLLARISIPIHKMLIPPAPPVQAK